MSLFLWLLFALMGFIRVCAALRLSAATSPARQCDSVHNPAARLCYRRVDWFVAWYGATSAMTSVSRWILYPTDSLSLVLCFVACASVAPETLLHMGWRLRWGLRVHRSRGTCDQRAYSARILSAHVRAWLEAEVECCWVWVLGRVEWYRVCLEAEPGCW